VSFSRTSRKEFLVLTHNIPGMTASEKKNNKSKVMFLENTSSDLPATSFLNKSTEVTLCFSKV
jgi:hypothetical protein